MQVIHCLDDILDSSRSCVVCLGESESGCLSRCLSLGSKFGSSRSSLERLFVFRKYRVGFIECR